MNIGDTAYLSSLPVAPGDVVDVGGLIGSGLSDFGRPPGAAVEAL